MLDGRSIFIRSKIRLANGSSFHETRDLDTGRMKFDFRSLLSILLTLQQAHQPMPKTTRFLLGAATMQGNKTVPIRDAIVKTQDTMLYCKDLLTPVPHWSAVDQRCSHSSTFQQSIDKTTSLLLQLLQLTMESGGVTVYSNQGGCDPDCFYYDGCPTVIANSKIAG